MRVVQYVCKEYVPLMYIYAIFTKKSLKIMEIIY